MFLLDGSDSIDSQEWNQARAFVARMINDFDISPQTINVGITVYSSDIDNHIPLSSQKIVLMARARMLQHPTGITTNTASGIKQIRDTFRASRQNAPKIMIVITDGTSVNPAETIRQAKAAQDEGIRMIAVGVGNQVFVEELQRIASNQRKYYPVADFNALRSIEADLRAMVCRGKIRNQTKPCHHSIAFGQALELVWDRGVDCSFGITMCARMMTNGDPYRRIMSILSSQK